MLGVQRSDARLDGAACDLAPPTLRLGDQQPEVVVDARSFAVAAPGNGGAAPLRFVSGVSAFAAALEPTGCLASALYGARCRVARMYRAFSPK
ncbi:MAG TPA: hypothetical protein VF516_33160 [Kofleriaceae bacterium]